MNVPIDGISISTTPEVIHIQSASPLSVLSSAVTGGGFRRARHILNFHVDKGYNCKDPDADLRARARSLGVHGSFIGLMTALSLHKARSAFFQAEGLSVGAVVSAGVNNASCAGLTPPFSYGPGTINVILLLNARLRRGAMLNAFITATEAKCAILQSRNVRTAGGDPATGTSTDTLTLAVTEAGALQEYAGPVTTIGWLIARAVRQALNDSLSAS
jgi:adenosylcobinamide hydrolase